MEIDLENNGGIKKIFIENFNSKFHQEGNIQFYEQGRKTKVRL